MRVFWGLAVEVVSRNYRMCTVRLALFHLQSSLLGLPSAIRLRY